MKRWGGLGWGVMLVFGLLPALAGVAAAAPGDLDRTFDGDGKRIIDYGGVEVGHAVASQSDGRIVLLGSGVERHFVITRLDSNGSFDTGFSGDGAMPIVFSGFTVASPEAMAVQPDGKIVVTGSALPDTGGYSNDLVLARVTPDGQLDAGFGSGGKRTFGAGTSDDRNTSVALLPDGKFMFSWGQGAPFLGDRSAVLGRLNPDGFGDSSFGFLGATLVDFPGVSETPEGLALLPDGRIALAVSTYPPATGGGAREIAAARILPSAFPDDTFDGDGKKTIGPGSAADVAVQPDGKILIGGSLGTSDFVVWRLNPDGSPDASFGDQGRRIVDFDGTTEDGQAIALQANGKILIAGTSNSGQDFAIARLQPNGEFDTTFNFDGKQKIDFGSTESAYAMALQANGSIVLAGATGGVGANMAVARLEGDPPSAGGGPAGGLGAGAGSGSTKAPRCAGKRATIVGTNRSERLKGTKKSDVIVGLSGNDRITGLRGNDRICAGKGKDRVSGGAGADTIQGGAGNDSLNGGAGNDSLKGEGDKDKLIGGAGRDAMNGGKGRDNCNGGKGNDRGSCERERSV